MTFSIPHLSSLSSSLHHLLQFTNLITSSLSPLLSLSLSMASHSLHPLHHHNRHHDTTYRRRRHSLDTSSPPPLPSSLFLKPIKTSSSTATFPSITFSTTTTNSATPAAPATSNQPTTFDLLQEHLSAQNFREADNETRRLLIQLAGEAAQKRGYVFFSEVQFISKQDLQAIDSLWRQHSNNKYGYSVQRKIWKKLNKDFTKFFIKLGWMKKLESSEVEQYNYKAFPDEFFWELADETPEGHLPLTNALRGTQLFTCILSHPAFEEIEGDKDGGGGGGYKGNFTTDAKKNDDKEDGNNKEEAKSPLSKKVFKPDYSF